MRCIIIGHEISDEVECGYKPRIYKVWRELLWSMSWLRPGDKFDNSIQPYPRYKSKKTS